VHGTKETDRLSDEISGDIHVVEHCLNFPRARKDIRLLTKFIEIHCRRNHNHRPKERFTAQGKLAAVLDEARVELCGECSRLLMHGATKRLLCPFDPKPRCKKCPEHCYGDAYRRRIKEVMRFSGAYLIRHGRVDLIYKYFF
jgi:hypothetical protein